MDKKRDRFLRLAPKRTNKVLESLRVLGNCSNLRAYEYENDEVDRIFREIEAEVRQTKAQFSRGSSREFKL
jgi:hypothetical protein